jgi:hypothetical protein
MQAIGHTVKMGSSIAGNIASKRAERRMRRRMDAKLKDMETREQRDYEQQYYADPLATAASQRTLSMMQSYLRDQRKAAAGQTALGLGTEESLAAQREADNDAVGNLAGQMAASATARREHLRDQHQTAQEGFTRTRMGWDDQHYRNRLGQIRLGVQAGYDGGNALIAGGKALNSAQGAQGGDEDGGGSPQGTGALS